MEEFNDLQDEYQDSEGQDAGLPKGAVPKYSYSLPDPIGFPTELRDPMTRSRERLEEWAKEAELTPAQAAKLWDRFCENELRAYNEHQIRMAEAQREEKERERDEHLNKIVENTDGNHLTAEEAQAWIEKIRMDPKHPYLNQDATPMERDRAVAFVDRLYQIAAGNETSLTGWQTEFNKKSSSYISTFGEVMDAARDPSSGNGPRSWDNTQGSLPEDSARNMIVE